MRGIKNKNEIIGIVYILPQLGVFRASNPSYRIFDIQTDNFAISNYHQYRLYIEDANEKGYPEWQLTYIFKFFYNVTNMEYQNIADALENIKVYNLIRLIRNSHKGQSCKCSRKAQMALNGLKKTV
jgi:hypothetical protein